MKENLDIAILQFAPHWEDVNGTLAELEGWISQLAGQTDLVLLPEMFTTGFTMNTELGRGQPARAAIDWMQRNARIHQALFMGSIPFMEANAVYNRLWIALPGGELLFYDKRHLFSYAGEDKYYQPGQKMIQIEWKGWKICPLLCYDLRFPVWSRNTGGYDLLVYLANWPSARIHAWKNLLAARAIENQCYVAGVNRTGTDGNALRYNGNSMVCGPDGITVWETPRPVKTMGSVKLSAHSLLGYRHEFPFLRDKDNFQLLPE